MFSFFGIFRIVYDKTNSNALKPLVSPCPAAHPRPPTGDFLSPRGGGLRLVKNITMHGQKHKCAVNGFDIILQKSERNAK